MKLCDVRAVYNPHQDTPSTVSLEQEGWVVVAISGCPNF